MLSRLLRLAVLGLVLATGSTPAAACIASPTDLARGRVFMPDGPHGWTSPIGTMRAGHPAFLTLGLLAKGDRWELPEAEPTAPVSWKAEPRAEGGFVLWLQAREGGQSLLPLRYVFANGQTSLVGYILIVEPPPPPPRPQTLDVDKAEYKGIIVGGRETILRLALPLPAGRRWEVKEAASFSYADTAWRPMAVEPVAGEAGAFRFVPRGEKARIILEEAGDGWVLLPDTVKVELIVDSSVPKC